MTLAAVIGLALFPFAIADVFSSGRGVEALDNLASGFAGYGARLLAFARILADRTVGDLLLGAGCVTAVVLAVVLWYRRHKGQELSMSREVRGILCMLIIPVVGYYLLASRMSPYLVDRYVMPMFPMIALLFALLLCCLGKRLAKDSGWKGRLVGIGLMALIIVVQGLRLASYDGEYLYRGMGSRNSWRKSMRHFPVSASMPAWDIMRICRSSCTTTGHFW